MFANQQLNRVHHDQHQHQIDAIIFEPTQRLPPTHSESMLQAAFAFLQFLNKYEFNEPQLEAAATVIECETGAQC